MKIWLIFLLIFILADAAFVLDGGRKGGAKQKEVDFMMILMLLGEIWYLVWLWGKVV